MPKKSLAKATLPSAPPDASSVTLMKIGAAVAAVRDVSTLLKTIIAELQPVFDFYDVGLFIVNQAENYHIDLVAEMPEISPSEVAYSLFERQLHKIPHHDSAVAWIVQQITAGQPKLFDFQDLMQHFPDYPQWSAMQPFGYRDCLATVLRVRGETIGMFCLNSLHKDHFSFKQFPLFQAIADQVAITLRNILAQEEVLAQKLRVEQLLTITQAITQIKDRQQLLRTIYQRIRPILPYDNCGLFILTKDRQQHYELIDAETIGYDPSQIAVEQQHGTHSRYRHPGSAVEMMMQRGPGLFWVEDFIEDHPQATIMYETGLRQLIAGPLTYGGETIGMLCFNSKQTDFYTEQHLPLFTALAEQLSVAVSNVLANEEVWAEKAKVERLHLVSEVMANVQRRDQLSLAFDRIRTVFPFDNAGLFVLTDDGQQHYELLDSQTLHNEPTQRQLEQQFGRYARFPHPNSPIAEVMQAEEVALHDLPELLARYPNYPQSSAIQQAGFKQLIAAPLRQGDKAIGLLNFNSKQADQYSQEDFAFVQAVAEQMSTVVNNVLANEDIQRRERFKTLQVELMRVFEVSYELKNNYQQAGRLLQAEIPYDLFVALRFETDSYQLQGGSYFYADQAGEGHWLREQPLLEGEVTNEQLLQGWCQDVEEGVRYLNGKDFADCLPPHAPVREAYRHLGVRSGLLGRTVLNANSSLLIACFSYHPEAYEPEHQHLLHRLLPTFRLVTDRSLVYRDVQRLTERLKEENAYLEEEIKLHYNFGEMVGESEALRQAFEQVQQVAATDSTVLILGETGTGKELVARAIHEQSPHREKTLIKINCAALPPQLIESELFGHERGAFTGAVQRRIGKFELAHGSTLFLDEIGELPLELQAKLLRVLQEKVFERLGSNEIHKTDARIVAATNRDLEAEVRQGTFRADLFYRLNVFPIHLPPLRQRTGDIPLLAQHFVNRYARKFKKPLVKRVSEETLRAFSRWSFPGNVRELEHLIERAVILSKRAEVTIDLPLAAPTPGLADNSGSFQTLRDNERALILRVLEYTHGKVRGKDGAAAILDIKPTTLESRMERLGIQKQVQFR